MTQTTIAAIATPLAAGGLSVIRISGENAIETADRVFRAANGIPLKGRKGYTAAYGTVFSGERPLDTSVAVIFRGPKSYTGEDVVELSCHGGILVTREILRAVLDAGASLAGPGEFTKRAFLNGKLNLTQAEAVADLIGADNARAMDAASAQLKGALSRRILGIQESLLELAGHLSAWVDYPEEDIPGMDEQGLEDALRAAGKELDSLLATFDAGKLVREGIDTVIAGKPNVGKSTLMNLLAGCQRSIVTDVAGTTRDVVEETVLLGDITLRLADTAGLHETGDPVEQIGVRLAQDRLNRASLILAVFDSSQPLEEEDRQLLSQLAGRPVVAVVNKSDLGIRIQLDEIREALGDPVILSAREETGAGLLAEAIKSRVDLLEVDLNSGILATERQRNCALRARQSVYEGLSALSQGMTLDAVTVSVEDALSVLMELTGSRVTEEVVNQVFSHFCVGK